jgi:hypothetical protein
LFCFVFLFNIDFINVLFTQCINDVHVIISFCSWLFGRFFYLEEPRTLFSISNEKCHKAKRIASEIQGINLLMWQKWFAWEFGNAAKGKLQLLLQGDMYQFFSYSFLGHGWLF